MLHTVSTKEGPSASLTVFSFVLPPTILCPPTVHHPLLHSLLFMSSYSLFFILLFFLSLSLIPSPSLIHAPSSLSFLLFIIIFLHSCYSSSFLLVLLTPFVHPFFPTMLTKLLNSSLSSLLPVLYPILHHFFLCCSLLFLSYTCPTSGSLIFLTLNTFTQIQRCTVPPCIVPLCIVSLLSLDTKLTQQNFQMEEPLYFLLFL